MVWDRWQRVAETRASADAIIHWTPDDAPYRWTFGALHASAMAMAWQLRINGVAPGDVCALIVRHHVMFYPLYLGVSYLGAIPAVLAYPNARLHPDKFREGLEGMAEKSGLHWILTERALSPSLQPFVHHATSSIKDVLFPLEWDATPPLAPECWDAIVDGRSGTGPDDPLLLQHSSGTTGLQKAVVLSHATVLGHLERYARALQLSAADKVASWLPLYHDMGLIAAFHLPLAMGLPSVQIDPFHWVSAPVTLLDVISRERCTLAWMPNFAYNLMADTIHEEDLADIRLDSVRLLTNCSEPVRADSHDKFIERFAPLGLRPDAIGACYAMAETTFAVTQTRPQVPARVIEVDRRRLSQGVAVAPDGPDAAVRRCVSSGPPIDGCEVRIVGDRGDEVPHGEVGHVTIRSESMCSGYRTRGGATTALSSDGWYWSGDVGFVRDGESYIVGRSKDIIIVAGNNVYPEDVEDAVGAVPGVIPGRVVAFGVENARSGTEQIEVAVETEVEGMEERGHLTRLIIEAAMALDLTVARVHQLPPRSLIKSSSGKPSRKANRDRILAAQRAQGHR